MYQDGDGTHLVWALVAFLVLGWIGYTLHHDDPDFNQNAAEAQMHG